ncbi:hypothetical protein AB1Y20_011835 [Prymnesium parvum]|uniref:EF-hand domain-containing protein n=1 Tax=Prymnesium parvum TaxID=97485 RepID=A0AB34IK94_PRYPA
MAIQKQRSVERHIAQASERRQSRIHQREAARLAALESQVCPAKEERRTAAKFPKRDVVMLKQIFDMYDADGSGSIDRTEFLRGLHKFSPGAPAASASGSHKNLLGAAEAQERSAAEITSNEKVVVDLAESLFCAMDKNKDGSVEFVELLKLFYPTATRAEVRIMLGWVEKRRTAKSLDNFRLSDEQRRQAQAMFAMYDKDRSGTIDAAEFREAMQRCGFNSEETDAMFAEADVDGNGDMDLEEFTELMRTALFHGGNLTFSMIYSPI